MPLGLFLTTLFTGRLVGRDAFGNRYYRSRFGSARGRREKRWVVYRGAPEASKVPPLWHAWLHKTTDDLPPADVKRWSWQKDHRPNPTGTPAAFRPKGHTLEQGSGRPKPVPGYQPWSPNGSV